MPPTSSTYPLHWNDVPVGQFVSGHGVHHVLLDQLLHTLQSDDGPPAQGREAVSQRTRGREGGGRHLDTYEGRRTAQGTLLPRMSLVTAHTYLS